MATINRFDDFDPFADRNTDRDAATELRPSACIVCETMLSEAVDSKLSVSEQRAFDTHVAGCVECSSELAEARRGAAWLSLLKSQTPEPPASLLARILAETSGLAPAAEPAPVRLQNPEFVPAFDPLWTPRVPVAPTVWATRVTAFRRMSGLFSIDGVRSTFQPRLAMTAAMAFFSIALTLNITGVRLSDLRAADFTPQGLQRTVANTTASVTRSFQNNRSVYQVESRLSEVREEDAPHAGGSQR